MTDRTEDLPSCPTSEDNCKDGSPESCTDKDKNTTPETEKGSETEENPVYSNLVEGGQNKCKVRCHDCGSLVLSPMSAGYHQETHPLPTPTQPRHAPSPITHHLCDWWSVEDMFTFDNIGFSHTVGHVKYLVCADCEQGPLGWHDTKTRRSYVALTRVKNEL